MRGLALRFHALAFACRGGGLTFACLCDVAARCVRVIQKKRERISSGMEDITSFAGTRGTLRAARSRPSCQQLPSSLWHQRCAARLAHQSAHHRSLQGCCKRSARGQKSCPCASSLLTCSDRRSASASNPGQDRELWPRPGPCAGQAKPRGGSARDLRALRLSARRADAAIAAASRLRRAKHPGRPEQLLKHKFSSYLNQ